MKNNKKIAKLLGGKKKMASNKKVKKGGNVGFYQTATPSAVGGLAKKGKSNKSSKGRSKSSKGKGLLGGSLSSKQKRELEMAKLESCMYERNPETGRLRLRSGYSTSDFDRWFMDSGHKLSAKKPRKTVKSSWRNFLSEHWPEYKGEMSYADFLKEAGSTWRSMSQREKEQF